jgi:ATP-dependent Lon protease
MPKMNSKFVKKDSVDSGTKAPDRKKPSTKKRAGGSHDDDDSVDSHGNIRGLIQYESEEEFESEDDTPSDASNLTPKQRREIRRSARAAAVKARKRIHKNAKDARKSRVVESEEEEEEEEEEEVKPKKKGFVPKKRKAVKEESEEEDEDEDEEDEDDEDEGEEDEEDEEAGHGGLIISFGGEEEENRMIPKRHNMKKESAEVKKFVELVTKPHEEGGIDEQIDEFKRLSREKQTELLTTLDRKATADAKSQSMMFKILDMRLTPETQSMVLAKYNSLQSMDPGAGEYYKQRAWLEKFSSLPLGVYRDIPVKMSDGQETCGAFMAKAQRCLGEAIYGQEEAKIQILQFIASKIANPDARGLSLLLAGPPGIGKTSLIKNGIAKALNWPFQFISLGGDSDASTYMGHQLVYEGSHCGKIANSLVGAKSMSMILMFDELDKISSTAKGEEVQNLLVHLTDPVQNGDFEDKYLSGVPLDLSKVLFTFSANDLGKIDRVLMDRMVVIELQGYTTKEKLTIAQTFLLPGALKDVNLDEKVSISQDVLEHILTHYANEEKGVRELKRCVEAVVQKINMLRIFNTKELPFHIPEFQLPFVVKKQHVDLFLKKKQGDMSHLRMYS